MDLNLYFCYYPMWFLFFFPLHSWLGWNLKISFILLVTLLFLKIWYNIHLYYRDSLQIFYHFTCSLRPCQHNTYLPLLSFLLFVFIYLISICYKLYISITLTCYKLYIFIILFSSFLIHTILMRLLLLHTFSTDFYVKPVSCNCQNHVAHPKLA